MKRRSFSPLAQALLASTLFAGVTACSAEINDAKRVGGGTPTPPPGGGSPGPGGGGTPGPGGGTPGPGGGTTQPPPTGSSQGPSTGPVAGFEVPNTHIKMLPWSVRLGRLAAVTGVPATDPSYATLIEDRLLLGDHDYANAKPPQEGWSAARLTLWVEGLRPICQTTQVRMRYSPMPSKLAALVEAAYGRALLPEDTAAWNESVAGLTVTPDKAVEAACVAVLSSLEFVAQ